MMLEHSYSACRAVTRRANSSFPLAFRLLSAEKHRAMDALYAFSRITDDIADEPGEPQARREALIAWRNSLDLTLSGIYSHPIHAALHDTVRRFAIPTQYLCDVIDGVEMDLEPLRFETFEQLEPYCYRVASAVGLACVRIWGVKPAASFADSDVPAKAAGIAFQLTNILRDLGEDAARGRDYLPREEVERFPNRSDLMQFQIERTRGYYTAAAALDGLLSNEGRAIFRVMSGSYRLLLERIARRPEAVFEQRVRVPRWRKGLIFLSAWPVKWGWL